MNATRTSPRGDAPAKCHKDMGAVLDPLNGTDVPLEYKHDLKPGWANTGPRVSGVPGQGLRSSPGGSPKSKRAGA